MSTGIRSFFSNLRKKRIIEILAAFIAGGWLIIEIIHFVLIGHYHFPEKTLDITIITRFSVLLCTLIWLKLDPKFDVLRSDPRFEMILKKIGLEE